MSMSRTPPPRTPKSPRKGIILDRVHPADFMKISFTYCCEQCSHFSNETQTCTFGYIAKAHLREQQLKVYEQTGRMAFCRYLEID